MEKQAPTLGRIITMVAFALSCFGLLLFLWLSFGGAIPLKPEGYRFEVAIPEAPTLPVEADVRLAGVTVGKVKHKQLDRRTARLLVEVEIEPEFAPIPKDARAILRQKTLLGESYVEITPGDRSAGMLADGGRLPDAQVEPTVELDEVFSVFDDRTQAEVGVVVAELRRALRGRRARDLNGALANLAGTASDGAALLRVLDEQRGSLHRLVKNGGVVLAAISERQGALGNLIRNSKDAFGALASRDDELAETVAILPAFQDELSTTVSRLERFAGSARPLVGDLRPAADELAPALRDLRILAPDLEAAFRDLGPAIDASRAGLPALGRVAEGAEPVVRELDVFLDELNPVLSTLSFFRTRVAGFLANGGPALNYDFGGRRGQGNVGAIDPRSFERFVERPEFDRGSAYLQPNVFNRVIGQGTFESLDCSHATGYRNARGDVAPTDATQTSEPEKTFARRPACLVPTHSLYDGRVIQRPRRGEAPVIEPPRGTEGDPPVEERQHEAEQFAGGT